MAREAAERTGKQVGILGDLPGPKLRIDDVEGGMVGLRPGSELTLTTREVLGTENRISISYEGLPAAVSPGGEIYMADGRIRLRVKECSAEDVICEVEVGGRVASHQGMNLPGAQRRAAGGRDATTSSGSTSRSSRESTCSPSRSSAAPRIWRRSSAASAPAAPTSR